MNDYILESTSVSDIELTQLFAEMAVLEAMMDCYEKQLVLMEYNEEAAEEIIEETYGLTRLNNTKTESDGSDNVKEKPSTHDESDIEKRAAKNQEMRSKLIYKIKHAIHKFLQLIVTCVKKIVDDVQVTTTVLPILKEVVKANKSNDLPKYDISKFEISDETKNCMLHLSEIIEEMTWCGKAVESLVSYRMSTTDETYLKNRNRPNREFTREKYVNNRGDYYKNPKDYGNAIDQVTQRCENIFKNFKYEERHDIDLKFLIDVVTEIANPKTRKNLLDIQTNVSKAYNEYNPDQTIPNEIANKLRKLVRTFMNVDKRVFKSIREFTLSIKKFTNQNDENVDNKTAKA